jgi:hypothetical protein
VLVVLLATAAAPGGPPKGPPPSRLEAVLKNWDSARQVARPSHYTFTWTVTADDPFEDKKTKEVWHGEVFLQRPDRLRVEVKDEQGQPALVVLLTGRQARLYRFGRKQELMVSLPDGFRILDVTERCIVREERRLGRAVLENLLWPVLGPPSQGLHARFVPRLEKEDAHWSCIRLQPKTRSFSLPDQEWQVVLHKRDGWVRQVWCSQPSGCLTVELKRPEHKPLPSSTWEPLFKDLPNGWTREEWPHPSQSPAVGRNRASGRDRTLFALTPGSTASLRRLPPGVVAASSLVSRGFAMTRLSAPLLTLVVFLAALVTAVSLVGVSSPADAETIGSVKEWTGRLEDVELQKKQPAQGFVTNKEDFARLWKAWMGKEAVPDVDFDKEVVLFATSSKGRIGGLQLKDDKGDARGVATLEPTPVKGFTFAIAVFKRGGLKTINGKPIEK